MQISNEAPTYDFKQANSLSADQLRELGEHCVNLCRALQRYVPESTGLTPKFSLESLLPMTFDEYLDQLPEGPILAFCEFLPNSSPVVWQLDTPFALYYMDAMLGGGGFNNLPQEHELTLLERSLAAQIVDEFLSTWSDIWPTLAAAMPGVIEARQTTGRFGTAALQEPVVVPTLAVTNGEDRWRMRIGLPSAVLRTLLKQTSHNTQTLSMQTIINNAQKGEVNRCQVTLTAHVGSANMKLSELHQLKEGDLIPLNRGPRDQLDVLLAGVKKFNGISGLTNGHLAVRITSRMDP